MKKLLLLLCFTLLVSQSFAQNWKIVGEDLPFHFANANNEAIEFGGDMYVVGYTYNGVDTYTPSVYKLSSGLWTQVGSGFTTTPTAAQYNINAVAEFDGDLFIGGNFTMNNGTDPEFYDVAKWDNGNSRWVAVGDGSCDGFVNELTVFDNKLYAGGDFDDLGAAGTNNIAVYDGVSWAAVGSGVSVNENGAEDPDQVKVMTIYDSKLYIAGKFDEAGGELVQNIAYWDGTNWGYFTGNGVTGYGGVGGFNSGQVQVKALQVFDSDLYIGGTFSKLYKLDFLTSTSISNHLAVWDGSVLSEPAKTPPSNTSINAMTVFDSKLFIGNSNESNIYSWNGSPIFNWELAPDRDPIRQRVDNFYSNGTDIYYVQDYGVYQLVDPLASFFASIINTCPDSEITFTDMSSGSNSITAWNWTFEGGTPATSTDETPVVSFAAGGPYDVTLEVTSSDGTNTLIKEDYITISDEVSVVSDPTPASVCSSENAVFTASGSGTNGVTYQWQINDGSGYVDLVDENNVISGATISQLTFITPSIDLDGANVKCVITNACGGASITTAEALFTVAAAPIITEDSFSQAVCEDGGDVDFTIASTGATTFQWQYYIGSNNYMDLSDAGAYAGTTSATLSITNANNTTILNELYDTDFSDGKTSALYRCVLTGNGCVTSTGLYYLTIYTAPTITEDPVDATKCDAGAGVSATFSVESTPSITGLTYQWQVDEGSGFVNVVDDAIYAGATSKSLSLTAATSDFSGYIYKCLVGNCTSPEESSSALLTINNLPAVVQSTVDTKVCEDGVATFTIEATGENLTYQWQERAGSSYVDIVDNAMYSQFDNTLEITGVTLSMDNYFYRCIVTSGTDCERTIGGSRLLVYKKQTLTQNTSTPSDLIVCDGGDATLRVNTSSGYNTGFHQLQWQVDFAGTGIFTDLSNDDERYTGVTTKILEITGVNVAMNENQYRCVVTNCDGSTASDPETLTVLQLPLVIENPQSQTVCHNDQVTFTAEATGSDLTYQWWVDTSGDGNFQTVSNSNANPDFTLTADRSFDGHIYKCIATAGNCTTSTAESFEATLTVHDTQISAVSENNVSICAGESATFSVTMTNPEGISFQWSDGNGDLTDGDFYTGVTTSSLSVNAPNTAINSYTLSISGDCGNTTLNYQLLVYGLGTPEIEAQVGSTTNPLLFVSNTDIFQLGIDNFEWYLNGNSYQNTGSDASVVIDQAGSYTVVATKNNCDYPESEAVAIIITGFENSISADDISFYPNPVSNKLTLKMGTDFIIEKEAKVILTNVNGKEVYSKVHNSPFNGQTEIDMSSYESGIYLVRVINGDKMTQYKIRKQ